MNFRFQKKFWEKTIEKQYYFRDIFGISINKRDERINHDSYMRGFVRNLEVLKSIGEALIVCPGSMATGKYLEAQVKNYFDFRVAAVIPRETLRNFKEQ